jgi:hypothetical protein
MLPTMLTLWGIVTALQGFVVPAAHTSVMILI